MSITQNIFFFLTHKGAVFDMQTPTFIYLCDIHSVIETIHTLTQLLKNSLVKYKIINLFHVITALQCHDQPQEFLHCAVQQPVSTSDSITWSKYKPCIICIISNVNFITASSEKSIFSRFLTCNIKELYKCPPA